MKTEVAAVATTGSFEENKDRGNKAFNNGSYEEALRCYLAALSLTSEFSQERAVILKNRAAVNLKLSSYKNVVDDCDKALDIVPDDPKALFRRCAALEQLGRYEEAYRDARLVLKVDAANRAIQPILSRLHRLVEERALLNTRTENKVKQMFKYAFDLNEETEKREKAVSNLVVLCKESGGAELLLSEGVVEKVQRLLKYETNQAIVLGCIRTIGQLCTGHSARTKQVISVLGIPWFLDLLNNKDEERVNAAQHCVQMIVNSLTGLSKEHEQPDKELLEANKAEIDTLLTCLLYGVTSRTISGLARDAIILLISRNVHWQVVNWADQLVKIKGLQRLMEVAGELPELKCETSMELTDSTKSLTSGCLGRIYENMYSDESRKYYLDNIDDYIKGALITPETENRIRVVVALTTLLLGPLDVGNIVVSRDGMMSMIFAMADSEDVVQQRVACECIIAASTKKDKVKSIVACGVEVLKKLYQSKDDGIRVRALVGLCKLGSSGGTDASIRPFADGATLKLTEACTKFLLSSAKDTTMKRWAAEGLSYLTLDADVKEKFVADVPALRALLELARSGKQDAVYGVITTFVNLVNAYDKQEVLPEMVELAKFAKHHIPEEHEFDDPDFVSQRCAVLVREGVASALVALSRTESENSREMIARVFNTLAAQAELRGLLVQQGAVKALLKLSHEGTDKGKRQSSQALARLGISIDPAVAFSGQKNMDVVRPLLNLLRPDCTSLENFEALLALCNLASMNETVRAHILKEGGLPKIESLMYEEHEMLRRAATQVMTNLVVSPQVVELYEGDNDRVKLLFLLCSEEDPETSKAAAGALAILTSDSSICCRKLLLVSTWLDIFHMILAHPDVDVQHRAAVIVVNLIASDRQLAETIIETDVMEILMAFTLIDEPDKAVVAKVAQQALNAAKKWNIIKAVAEPPLKAGASQPPPETATSEPPPQTATSEPPPQTATS